MSYNCVSTPQPFPAFYIYRPGHIIVPLIPLDELPSWIQVGDFNWKNSELYDSMLPASFHCYPRLGEYDVICHHCYAHVDGYHRSVSERSDSTASSRAPDSPPKLEVPALAAGVVSVVDAEMAGDLKAVLPPIPCSLKQPPFYANLNSPFVGMCMFNCPRWVTSVCPILAKRDGDGGTRLQNRGTTNPPETNPPDTNPPDTNPPDTNPPGGTQGNPTQDQSQNNTNPDAITPLDPNVVLPEPDNGPIIPVIEGIDPSMPVRRLDPVTSEFQLQSRLAWGLSTIAEQDDINHGSRAPRGSPGDATTARASPPSGVESISSAAGTQTDSGYQTAADNANTSVQSSWHKRIIPKRASHKKRVRFDFSDFKVQMAGRQK
ncbi:hypothetical protein BO71DRAFT_97517 [Aspergillus ellipticus CBS 707.79]|uniref:Uncharacterized protein n=1 Tax=Aspergillus ellipticus CBS 707.79 TaxID=1448320 RepID=A0A319CYP0_9EURO|nr:hypothetical protein BO71DRAFT_97517 [Aspergillus ellipticus CBS 707.79]